MKLKNNLFLAQLICVMLFFGSNSAKAQFMVKGYTSTMNTITVNWKPFLFPNPEQYYTVWHFDSDGAREWVNDGNSTGTSLTINNLTANHSFDIRVYAYDPNSNLSPQLSRLFLARTKSSNTIIQTMHPPYFNSVSVTPYSATITFNWHEYSLTRVNGFYFYYRKAGTTNWIHGFTYNIFTHVFGDPVELNDLQPGTDYETYIEESITYNPGTTYASDHTFTSGIIGFTTIPVCAAPAGLINVSATETSVTVSWVGNGNASNYKLRYRPAGTTTWNQNITGIVGNTATITGLTRNKNYEYQVASNCPYQNGIDYFVWSSIANTKTEDMPVPTNLAVAIQNETTTNIATFSWNRGTGTAENYFELQYRALGAAAWTTVSSINALGYTLPTLAQGMHYEWRVRSVGIDATGTHYSSYAKGKNFYSAACRIKTATISTVTNSSIAFDWTTYTEQMGTFSPKQYELVLLKYSTTCNTWVCPGTTSASDTQLKVTLAPMATNTYTFTGLPASLPVQGGVYYTNPVGYSILIRVLCMSGTYSDWFMVTDPKYPKTQAAELFKTNTAVTTMCADCNVFFDAGNTMATATTIDVSSSNNCVFDRIQNGTDVDWYKFTAPVGTTTIQSMLQWNGGNFTNSLGYYATIPAIDMDFALYNAAGTLLQSSAGANTPELIDRTITTTTVPKVFYLKVYRHAATTGNNWDNRRCYNFSVSFTNSAGVVLNRIAQPSTAGRSNAAPYKTGTDNTSIRAEETGALKLLPNPAQSTVTVYYNTDITGKTFLSIYDMAGRRVYTKETPSYREMNSAKVDVSHLANGTYMVKMQTGNDIKTEKLVVNH